MCGQCPFAFPQSPSTSLHPVRPSYVPSGCLRPSSSTTSTMAAPCIDSSGQNRTRIRTIILGVSRPPFSRADMWKRSLRSARTAAGKAHLSSACRARGTGSKPAISIVSSACRKARAGQSSRPDRTNARRCFGGLAISFSAEPGMSDAGVPIDRRSRAAIASLGSMMPGDDRTRETESAYPPVAKSLARPPRRGARPR